MSPRETFETTVREAFQPYFALHETLDLGRLDEALNEILAAGDEYAAAEAERIAHPPYHPARKIDLGHEKAKRAKTRGDGRKPA